MPLFIQLHHMPSTWPVMLVATLHRSFWLKEIVRCGAANLPVVLVQSKLRMDFLLESWTKRIRRHRKILVLTFKVQARALPHCILIADSWIGTNEWHSSWEHLLFGWKDMFLAIFLLFRAFHEVQKLEEDSKNGPLTWMRKVCKQGCTTCFVWTLMEFLWLH